MMFLLNYALLGSDLLPMTLLAWILIAGLETLNKFMTTYKLDMVKH